MYILYNAIFKIFQGALSQEHHKIVRGRKKYILKSWSKRHPSVIIILLKVFVIPAYAHWTNRMNELFRYKIYKKNKIRAVFFSSVSVHCYFMYSLVAFQPKNSSSITWHSTATVFRYSVRISRFVTYAHIMNHNAKENTVASSMWWALKESERLKKMKIIDRKKKLNLIYGARRDDKKRKTNIN